MTLSIFASGAMFGERTGTGEVEVVALHGWRKTHTDLNKVVDGFNAISLDLPGFGATPEPSDGWGAREYANAVASVIEELPGPVVVFGHSFGGRVAVCLAASRPELVKSLVITGVPLIRKPNTAKPPLAFRLAKFANKVGLLSDERMEAERRKRGSDDYNAAQGVMREVFVRVVNESYENELAQIQCPVEFVWGELDTAAPIGQGREGEQLVKQSSFTVVEGGSHWIVNDNPEPLRQALRRCLA